MQLPGQQDNQAEDGHQRDQDDRDDRGRQMQDGRRTHTGIFVSGARDGVQNSCACGYA